MPQRATVVPGVRGALDGWSRAQFVQVWTVEACASNCASASGAWWWGGTTRFQDPSLGQRASGLAGRRLGANCQLHLHKLQLYPRTRGTDAAPLVCRLESRHSRGMEAGRISITPTHSRPRTHHPGISHCLRKSTPSLPAENSLYSAV